MMLIMATSPIAFPRSFGGLQIRPAAYWLPDCIHNGKLTCQRTIQPGSRLKLVLREAVDRGTAAAEGVPTPPPRRQYCCLAPARFSMTNDCPSRLDSA